MENLDFLQMLQMLIPIIVSGIVTFVVAFSNKSKILKLILMVLKDELSSANLDTNKNKFSNKKTLNDNDKSALIILNERLSSVEIRLDKVDTHSNKI